MKNKIFTDFYKLLSVIAVIAVIISVLASFSFHLLGGFTFPLVSVFVTVLVILGYAMQSFYGALTKGRNNSRKDYFDESGYEATDNPFSPLHAALPLTVGAILGVVFYGIADRIMYAAWRGGQIEVYDPQSIYPPIAAILVFLLIGAGSYLWFFPAHRIISLRTIFGYFGVMCLTFAMTVIGSAPAWMMTVALTVFSACAFIVLNQTFIRKGVSGTVTAISNEGKFYNMKLMLVAFAVVLAILIVFASAFTAIGFVLRFIFAYVMSRALSSGGNEYNDQYYDLHEAEAAIGRDALFKNQPVGDKFLIFMFIAFFIVGIIFLVTRGSEATKRLIAAIQKWLRELFLAFMDMRSFFDKPTVYFNRDFMNYQDEKIDLQDAEIRSYVPKMEKGRSYRDFLSRLNSLPNSTYQLRFAYTTMLSVYRSLGYGIRASETPRETNDRVNARSVENSITNITDAIEMVDYVEREPSEEETERAIRDMCRIISGHFEA